MIPLRRAMSGGQVTGEALPTVWPELKARGVDFRRGQVSLIASAPNVGKTIFAEWFAMHARVPTVYISADTDPSTMYVRGIAMILPGWTVAQVEAALERTGRPPPELADYDHVRYSFDPNPSIADVWECCQVMAIVDGEYPHLIVIDTVSDVRDEEGQTGAAAWDTVLQGAAGIARKTGAHVMCLHHLVADYDDGDRAPTQSSMRGKVSKRPSLILGLYTPRPGVMGITVVKNRRGAASALGTTVVELACDKATMTLGALT